MAHDSVPLPEFTHWPTFPFEGDLRVRRVDPPVEVEPPRNGEDPASCTACLSPDTGYLWVSDRWRVRSLDRPTGLPMVLILESRSHLDLGDLPNLLAAELGVMTVRLERAIRSLDGVARVHVNRWGDGAAHLHLWFLARPLGRLQLRGTFLSLWDDILPVIPESQWRRNLAHIGAWLAEFGGRSYAETPRIDWQTPLSIDGLARGTTWASIVEPPAESDSTAESASAATSDLSGSAVSGPADAVEPKDADTPAVVDPTVVPDMLAADVTVKADLAETDLAEPGLAETDATGVPIAVAAPEACSTPTRRETKGQRHRLAPDSGDPDELWLDGDGPSWT